MVENTTGQTQYKYCPDDSRIELRFIVSFVFPQKIMHPTPLISRVALNRFINCFDKQLIVEGLAQEGDRTCLERSFTDIQLVVGGDEDNWWRVFTTHQELLNLQAVHSWHLYIEHDTVRPKRRHRLDVLNELVAGCERVGSHSQRAEQPAYSATDGCIVIHNGNCR